MYEKRHLSLTIKPRPRSLLGCRGLSSGPLNLRRYWWIHLLGGGLLLGLLLSGYLYPQLLRCELAVYNGFSAQAPRLYIHREVSTEQRRSALVAVRKAEKRVRAFWGQKQGRARILVCSSVDQYERYCRSREGAGCSLASPWGSSYIVLNHDGLNTDVISHEMCHDELFTRLGWWVVARQIPQWFNEGLALMLDYRFVAETDPSLRHHAYQEEWRYLSQGEQPLTLTQLKSVSDFFGGDSRHVMLAYMTSAREVARWLEVVGDKGLSELIEALTQQGHSFEEAYKNIEQQRKAGGNKPTQNLDPTDF